MGTSPVRALSIGLPQDLGEFLVVVVTIYATYLTGQTCSRDLGLEFLGGLRQRRTQYHYLERPAIGVMMAVGHTCKLAAVCRFVKILMLLKRLG